jgi:hypothetical protein
MLLVEEVIAPGRFDALMKFDMYPGQTEYGEYALRTVRWSSRNYRATSTIMSLESGGSRSGRSVGRTC